MWGPARLAGKKALLIPLPFLFQRARQVDEELNRRGSPVPKKVGGFSAQGILCFRKPATHSWPFPQYEHVQVHGSFWDALEVLTLVPPSFSPCDKNGSFPGKGKVTERVLLACTAESLKDFFLAEKGAASRTEPVERSWGLRHGCVSMGPALEPLFWEGRGGNEAAQMRGTETPWSPSLLQKGEVQGSARGQAGGV